MQEVVGYIRVSTNRQAEEGISLDEQARMVRGYCSDKKLRLISIEEDDCSAAGSQGHLFRPGLRQAIRIAKEKEAAILVPSVDRLARHPGVLPELISYNVPVISIAERRRIGRRTLERLVNKAQRDHNEIARRAREGMARAKAKGVKLGNPTNLPLAQRKGAISNAVRSDRKVQELADFLERTPGWEKMVLRELVETVNQSGLHNLISEKRNERRPWTVGSIRKPLQKAKHEMGQRQEMEAEESDAISNFGMVTAQGGDLGLDTTDNDIAKLREDDVPANIAYKDHPGFGDF